MEDRITIESGEFDYSTLQRVCQMLREEAVASERLAEMMNPATPKNAQFWKRLYARELRAISDRLESLIPDDDE